MSIHRSVLLKEIINGLNLGHKSLVLDATFGGGGHSAEICQEYKGVRIIAIDRDAGALEKGKDKFSRTDCNISFHNANFRNLAAVLQTEKIEAVDGIIFDLGLSSDQLENSLRGFSFMKNEPLVMTMKKNPGREEVTAFDVVNTWSESSLAEIIYGFGEEKFSRRIAKEIVKAREKSKIEKTFDLVKVIGNSIPARYRKGRLHYATKTFQAIRIAVNDELGALKEGLEEGFGSLKGGGRMAVISFHSLEDRIVKRFYKKQAEEKKGKLINKKPITASIEEIKNNPRSRSAKLRILEKI